MATTAGRDPRPRAGHRFLVVAVVGAAALYPQLDTSAVTTFRLIVLLLDLIALIGLDIAMGYAGLLTIATGAIFGIGAYSSAVLDAGAGVPLIPSMLLGTAFAAVIGLTLLAPALRLGRAAYAMLSLYMAAALVSVLQLPLLDGITHATTGLNGIHALVRAVDTNGDATAQAQQMYYVVLFITLVAAVVARRFTASHWGRTLIAVRDDDVSAASLGISAPRTRMVALGIASLFAAGAGSVFAHANQSCLDECNVSAGTFGITLSIFFFSALVIGGRATVWGPVLGAGAVGAFQVFASDVPEDRRQLVYGLLLIAVVVLMPGGLEGGLRALVAASPGRRRRPVVAAEEAPERVTLAPLTDDRRMPLAVEHLEVRFGGVHAVRDVSFAVTPGTVHALIGANGSGKTTVLNGVGGLVAPQNGRVRLGDGEIGDLPPYRRARLGLARTFQTPRVAARLTVLDNTLQGAFLRYRSGWLGLCILWGRHRADDVAVHAEARRLLAVVRLADRAHLPAATLGHGERRLLEVARALMTNPAVLLLDEPASGLGAGEIDELVRLLLAARDAGTAVLLVEHNLAFVRRVATAATVLERGGVIASGTPDEVLAEPRVIETFVGPAP